MPDSRILTAEKRAVRRRPTKRLCRPRVVAVVTASWIPAVCALLGAVATPARAPEAGAAVAGFERAAECQAELAALGQPGAVVIPAGAP